MPVSELQIAIDVGGTFTDLVVQAEGLGRRTFKSSSTPADPSQGVMNGLALVAADLDLDLPGLLDRTAAIVHGTTITTNALLTRTGARTGLLTTAGFADALPMRRGRREDVFVSKSGPPAALVPRRRIAAVPERVDRSGAVIEPLVESAVREAAQQFREQGIEAVAIAMLFSFLNDAHEKRSAELLAEELPGAYISLSSVVSPQVRLYERTSTTVVNAYVGPILERYLQQLEARLAERGYDGPILIMQSNGGVTELRGAGSFAVNTLLSGPAGGPVASASILRRIGVPKALTIDMGGTSFEVSIATGHEPALAAGGELAGFPIATQMLDISTLGAGGGSIASLSPGGILEVGPASAGAEPGPACYGRGGTEPTVTDANLVLGYLDEGSFGSGGMRLDLEAGRVAIATIALPLGLDVPQAAAAIVATVNSHMADSLNLATVKRGRDPRDFALVAAGGAGPLHAVELARELGCSLVIVPRQASVLCAEGMCATDIKHHYARTILGVHVTDEDPVALEALFAGLEQTAREQLESEGVGAAEIELVRTADVRSVGQINELEIEIAAPTTSAALERLLGAFHATHERRFGFALRDEAAEIINLRVHARGHRRIPEPPFAVAGETGLPTAVRTAWFRGGLESVAVYAEQALGRDTRIEGPALIELPTTTVVVPPGWLLCLGEDGSLLIHDAERDLGEVLAALRSSTPSQEEREEALL